MKLTLIPILILILIPILAFPSHARQPSPPQGADPALKEIRKKYKNYERQREDFKKIDLKAASRTSSEGTSANAFLGKSGNLLIIDESYYREMGRATWSYYFEGTKPFFVLVSETNYAYPITVSAAERQKLGGAQDTTTETRYYFHHDKLIRWLEGKKPVSTKGGRYKEQGRSILEAAKAAYENAKTVKTETP